MKLKVGEISKKYDRGIHTTRFAIMLKIRENTYLIDSPGIRELFLFNLDPRQLTFYFPDFTEHANLCSYGSCRHINEPGCKVKEAVEAGHIHPDRYESYLRIYENLSEQREDW
jgi:ribosome biogenesis GTPase / thiamine phosphate phosphatase